MYVTPYIFFNGNCAEALGYYEKALGARVLARMTYGDSPAKDQVAKEMHGKVMHSAMAIGNTMLMAADDCMSKTPIQHGGYSLTVSVDSADKARHVFDALADGGTVSMPLDKTFFAEAFGVVQDRYGVRWMVICEAAH
ncbi:VOC family protein [Rhizomicrobium electricum]|jgi:PhnB protein|uniref:VOC family protein n=1 Tax=Rhizomicrobium electricum TaxID=480070 RepID=A0ABN1EHY4_9PROT|nr:VOC family protein [Rhizomicrobium electricum]NIJ48416.1 PhnB protein [Rhizomicrobium electricum]